MRTPPSGPNNNPALAAGFTCPTKHMPDILSPSISPSAIVVMVSTRGNDQATKWKYARFLSILSCILPEDIIYLLFYHLTIMTLNTLFVPNAWKLICHAYVKMTNHTIPAIRK